MYQHNTWLFWNWVVEQTIENVFLLIWLPLIRTRHTQNMAYTYTHSTLRLNTPQTPSAPLSNLYFHPSSTRFFYKPLRFKGLSAKSNKRSICEAVKSSMAVQVEVFEKEALAVSLAKYVADLSNKFTQQRGAFTVCLSGGSLINYLQWVFSFSYCYYWLLMMVNWIELN